MMQIEVSKRAQRQWVRILTYYNEVGGANAAAKLHRKYLQKQERLIKFPESGFPEPLLRDKRIQYRAVIISDFYKVIYYVKGNHIRIAAFWDMRMHPEKLRKTLK